MDDLTNLKNQILDDLIGLIDEEGIEPAERFDLLLTRYLSAGDASLLQKAYEAAKSIEDSSARGNALMQLLEEVNIAQAEPAEQPAQTETHPDEPESSDSEAVSVNVNRDSEETEQPQS